MNKDKILYIYESHTGSDNFVSEVGLTDEQRYCKSCDSYDTLLYKGTRKEILKKLRLEINKWKRRLKKAETTNEQIDVECEIERAITRYSYIDSILTQYCWDLQE